MLWMLVVRWTVALPRLPLVVVMWNSSQKSFLVITIVYVGGSVDLNANFIRV